MNTQQADTVRDAIRYLTDASLQLNQLRAAAHELIGQAQQVGDSDYALVPTHLIAQLTEASGGAR